MRFLVVLVLAFALPTFAASGREPASAAELIAALPPVPPDKAQIVFLKPSAALGVKSSGIYAISMEGDRRLLGVMNFRARLIELVEPGDHLFMVYDQGGANFLKARVDVGKRYFVLVRFMYAWHQLRPIRPGTASDYDAGQPEFVSWLKGARDRPARPEQIARLRADDHRVAEAQARGWEKWLQKSEEERAQLTLLPEHAL